MPLPFSNSAVTDYGMPTSPTIGFKNFAGISKVDPQTDQDASEMNRELSDLSQVTRSCARGFVLFTSSATPTVTGGDAMWGNGLSVTPAVSHIGTGHCRITLPATVTDPLGNTGAINIRSAMGQAKGSTRASVQCDVLTANTIEVYVWDASGTATDTATSVVVWFN
jgi:hypothetical protein